jgi:hypothetical protein
VAQHNQTAEARRSEASSAYEPRRFSVVSAQTGDFFGFIFSDSEEAALDAFARQRFGYPDRQAMWAANSGALQYLSAVPS